MVEASSNMFVTGPRVVKTVTHQKITSEELGGAQIQAPRSGGPAPADGEIADVRVAIGHTVKRGDVLIRFKANQQQ